ncbi:MAG: hypothetical protein F6K11_31040 [Leptolyngbya sp. SIO3F4]|nr:hypothetical protein [Leptolyngbya sp. SIO3F4]
MGLEKGWLANARFFLLCFTSRDLSDMSQLLDLVDKHNQLVSAIDIDMQKAVAVSNVNQDFQDLHTVMATFLKTKRKILQAIASNNSNCINHTDTTINNDIIASDAIYGGLTRQSHSLAITAQELASRYTVFTNSTVGNHKTNLKNNSGETTSLHRTVIA